ncbi:MAG: phosphoglycerate mutase family protein [Paucimonas sp.]|nr:phosphoglycerate mutase family protein [Paucimonas sp.]
MTELILIRHGETAWNAERRLQGHLDIPLNEEGRRQAAAVARALAGCGASAILASDLGRALDTASPLARLLGLPVKPDARLRERAFGAFEGLLYDEIHARFPQAWRQWQAREVDARYPDGESRAETLSELAQRVATVLADIASAHPEQKIVAITHGGFLDCAYRLATGMDLVQARNFDVRNAGINRFAWHAGSGLRLLDWGAVDHLDDALDETVR